MPIYRIKPVNGALTHNGFTNHCCFAEVYRHMKNENVELFYNADPQDRPEIRVDGAECRFDFEFVKKHVSLLKRCGFVFEFDQVKNCGMYSGLAAVPCAYRFTMRKGKNGFVFQKFLLSGLRWLHQNTENAKAFHLLCDEGKPQTEADTFSMMCIAAQCNSRGGGHSIGDGSFHTMYRPFTQAEFKGLREYSDYIAYTGMSSHLKRVPDNLGLYTEPTSKNAYSTCCYDMKWLAEPGAYARYMGELERNINYKDELKAKAKLDITTALGVAMV